MAQTRSWIGLQSIQESSGTPTHENPVDTVSNMQYATTKLFKDARSSIQALHAARRLATRLDTFHPSWLYYFHFAMKPQIHPTYYETMTVKCACGNSFVTGSTKPELQVELCHKCHPFFTGKQKFVDTARRVEKFKEKQEKSKVASVGHRGKKAKSEARARMKKEAAEKTPGEPTKEQ